MKRSLLNTYLKYHGLVLMAEKPQTQLFVPCWLMDFAYQIYCKEILPIKAQHQLKRHKNLLRDRFQAFNKAFMLPFSDEQKDDLFDEMDALADYLGNDLALVQVALSDAVSFMAIDDQRVITNLYLINVLCECAEWIWERSYFTHSLGRGDANADILGIKNETLHIAELYYPADVHVSFQNKRVGAAIDVLCRHLASYSNQQRIEED